MQLATQRAVINLKMRRKRKKVGIFKTWQLRGATHGSEVQIPEEGALIRGGLQSLRLTSLMKEMNMQASYLRIRNPANQIQFVLQGKTDVARMKQQCQVVERNSKLIGSKRTKPKSCPPPPAQQSPCWHLESNSSQLEKQKYGLQSKERVVSV